MKITVHQQNLLLLEKQMLALKEADLREARCYEKPLGFGTNPSSSDYGMAYKIVSSSDRKSEINRILATSEIIQNPNSRAIQLGSVADIMVKYDDGDMMLHHIELVEKKVGMESSVAKDFNDLIYITQESPLGSALLNKEVGEKFRYNLADGEKVVGQVISLTFERKEIGETRLRMKKIR